MNGSRVNLRMCGAMFGNRVSANDEGACTPVSQRLGSARDRVLADIDRSLPAVYDYLLHRCGGRALAEDLTSETVLATVDHVRNGHIDTIEIGYLIGIARHKLVDHWRRREREQRHFKVYVRDEKVADDDGVRIGSRRHRAR